MTIKMAFQSLCPGGILCSHYFCSITLFFFLSFYSLFSDLFFQGPFHPFNVPRRFFFLLFVFVFFPLSTAPISSTVISFLPLNESYLFYVLICPPPFFPQSYPVIPLSRYPVILRIINQLITMVIKIQPRGIISSSDQVMLCQSSCLRRHPANYVQGKVDGRTDSEKT